jgi:hypothetical protein
MAGLGSWVGGSVGKGLREYSALAGSDGFNIIGSDERRCSKSE